MAIDEGRETRILQWEGCYNARELGGYRTEDGRETRWGRVVRADNLLQLTEDGRQSLLGYGVRTIIDLRLPQELEIHPPPFRGHEAVDYRHMSLVDPATVGDPLVERLADDYKGMLDRFKSRIAEIMEAIAGAPEGVVVIHCHAGKDRTGLISALLLRLAGVPRETVAEDYGLTLECLRPWNEEWLENGPNDRAWREKEYARGMARAEIMDEVLEDLEGTYGSVQGYLRAAGVSDGGIERLKGRLLH